MLNGKTYQTNCLGNEKQYLKKKNSESTTCKWQL